MLKKGMAITAATLTLTAACDGTPPPLEHASLDFTTTVDGQEVFLPTRALTTWSGTRTQTSGSLSSFTTTAG
jgi:hypothetical protein